jgi:hypothetical protein
MSTSTGTQQTLTGTLADSSGGVHAVTLTIGAAVQPPVPTPVPTPTPTPAPPVPSPDGTSTTALGTRITDVNRWVWTLVAADASGQGQQCAVGGVRDTRTANAVRLYAKGGIAYHCNTGGQWWHLDYVTNVWQGPDADPTIVPPVTTPTPIVTPPPTTGTGPAVSGNFVNADFATAFGVPVLAGAWGVSTGGAGDGGFAAFADPALINAFATINPRLWRFNGNLTTRGDSPFFNNDGSVNTGTWANIVNNFYKANPTGDSGIIIGVNTNGVVGFSDPASYGKAMGNLARYLRSAKMGNGAPFPILGFESHNEPDGNVDTNMLVSYYNPAYAAIKAVDPTLMMFGPVTSYIQGGGGFSWGTFFNNVLGCDGITWHAYLGGYSGGPTGDPGTGIWSTTRGTDDANAIPGAVPAKYRGTSVFLGEYNVDWNCQSISQGNEVGAVFDALMVMQVIDACPNPMRAAIWDAYADGTCGIVQPGGGIVPGGYFLGKAGGTVYGPRVACNRPSGLITCATMPAPGRITVMAINKGNSLSGPVALSHWPGNASGSGNVNMWQQSLGAPNGGSSSVAVTAGMTGSIALPAGSITILYT